MEPKEKKDLIRLRLVLVRKGINQVAGGRGSGTERSLPMFPSL